MWMGMIRPRAMAVTTNAAVAASDIVTATSSGVVDAGSCASPLSVRNTYTPGTSATTAAKPMAANGIRSLCETGASTAPTSRQARNAELARLRCHTVVAHQCRAWAAIPVAIGQPIIR